MNQHARMTKIELDAEEGVAAITFHVDQLAIDWLSQALGFGVHAPQGRVVFDWPNLRKILAAGGKMRPMDNGWEASTEIYTSLCAVFYGYLDDEG